MKVKQSKTDENDFDALDRLARGITPEKLRPLTPQQRRLWEAAKRGWPKKAPGTKAVPTLITVEPLLLRRVDAYAKKPASVDPNSFPTPSGGGSNWWIDGRSTIGSWGVPFLS